MKRLLIPALCLSFLSGLLVGLAVAPASADPATSALSSVPATGTPDLTGGTGPNPKGGDIAAFGVNLVVGGNFTGITWRGTATAARNLVTINGTTGQPIRAFQVDGEVFTVAVSGSTAYIGGKFTHVGSLARHFAARVDLTTGAVLPWNPNPTGGAVQDIAITSTGQVLIGGNFTAVSGQARTLIASVDATTGAPTTFLSLTLAGRTKPQELDPALVYNITPLPGGAYVLVTGNFVTVNGAPHRRVFVIQTGGVTARLIPWHSAYFDQGSTPNYGTDCSAVFSWPELGAFGLTNVTFALADTGGAHGGSVCDSITYWKITNEADVNATPTWRNYAGGDTLSGVWCNTKWCVASGHQRFADSTLNATDQTYTRQCSDVYPPFDTRYTYKAGYNCHSPGDQDRHGLAQYDLTTGKATTWNPVGHPNSGIHERWASTPAGLWLTGDGEGTASDRHVGLMMFPWVTP